jgi:hypothetical protein
VSVKYLFSHMTHLTLNIDKMTINYICSNNIIACSNESDNRSIRKSKITENASLKMHLSKLELRGAQSLQK